METIKKNKILYITIVVLILINVALMTFLIVNRPGGDRRSNHDRKHSIAESVAHHLKLNEEQKASFELQLTSHLDKMKAISVDMQTTKTKLGILLKSPESDEVNVHLDSLSKLHRAQEEEIFRHTVELYEICNQDQQRKLENMYNQSFKRGKPMD